MQCSRGKNLHIYINKLVHKKCSDQTSVNISCEPSSPHWACWAAPGLPSPVSSQSRPAGWPASSPWNSTFPAPSCHTDTAHGQRLPHSLQQKWHSPVYFDINHISSHYSMTASVSLNKRRMFESQALHSVWDPLSFSSRTENLQTSIL